METVFFKNNSWHHTFKQIDYQNFVINYLEKGGFQTKEKADASYLKCKEKFEDEIRALKEATNIRYTFTEYLDFWFKNICIPYKETQAGYYHWAIYNIIYPSTSRDMLLNFVSGAYLNDILDSCEKICKSAAPAAKKVIMAALKDAIIDGCLPQKIISEINNYPLEVPKIELLNSSQIRDLLREAKKYNNGSVYLEILLALFCGLRRGETRGLRFSDFNLKERTVEIRRQYIKSRNVSVNRNSVSFSLGDGYFTSPKTENSYRKLQVPDVILEELKRRKNVNREILKKHPNKKLKDHVSIGYCGTIMGDETYNSALHKIAVRANIHKKISYHSLRHIFCSILLESGLSLELISKILGHSRCSTTFDIYCGIIDAEEKIANVIEESLNPLACAKVQNNDQEACL